MKTYPHSLRLAGAGLMLLVAAACNSAPPAVQGSEGSAALWQRIQSANAVNSCERDSQCHSMAVGAKACGGPENYLAWSDNNADAAKLKQLVEQHAAARRDEDARAGLMSTCQVTPDPGATCRAGRCELRTPQPGQPGGGTSQQ
ncbi:MAG: hypothetical protein V4641_19535 [Pseudomonadota bacterium]|jgi:hypothetical protein